MRTAEKPSGTRGQAANLDNVFPVKHEVGVSLMPPEVGRVGHQEPEVGLQEFVTVVRLRPRRPLAATAAPPGPTAAPGSVLHQTHKNAQSHACLYHRN